MKSDDLPFRHFTLRHRIEAWISTHFFSHITYTARRGLVKGMRRKGGLGWIPGGSLSKEQQFLASLDYRDKVVWDVGAFVGLMTMFFAQNAKHVVSFEPNPINQKNLQKHLTLNGLTNVTVRPVGLGAECTTAVLTYFPLMAGAGGITVAQHADDLQEKIELRTIDSEVAGGLPVPDFIKVDVEGFEAEVLRGAEQTLRTNHPALYLEMHGETMNEKRRKVAEIVELLCDFGYSRIRHIETDTSIDRMYTGPAAQGHLYAVG